MTRWGIALLLTLLAAPAVVAEPPPSPMHNEKGEALPPLPWDQDLAVMIAANPGLQSAGIRALASHVGAYEDALRHAPHYFPDGVVAKGRRYILVDGRTENKTVAEARGKKDQDRIPMEGVENFYVLMALQLGTYYDEMDREEDGVRVLDLGLMLSPDPAGVAGDHVAQIMSEKGFALGVLKKYDLALATYQKGMSSRVLTAIDRARLERGKGFILTEMGRLDEAEAAYQESLKDEPDNQRALRELAYIAGLRAGRPKAPTESVLVQPPEQPNAP